MSVAIKFENVSKQYRLGEVGTGTLAHDLQRAWAKLRGKPDPFAKVGQVNDRTQSSTKHQEPGTKNSAASDYVWALKDINFEVQQGEILGIIGRNGAGKSTLLKLLSRVTAPTTGSIKSRGRIASLLEVGTGFHPELTGRENIYLNGTILGMRRHEITKQLEEIVEFSGCAKYIDTPVKRYSSGMMVRLGFAVAAHLDCEILVVDEVLAVGDWDFQKKCIDKMQSVSRSGSTLLFVSHNLGAVRQLCSRCVIFENGELIEQGDTDAMISSYMSSDISTDGQSEKLFRIDETKPFQLLRSYVCSESGFPANSFSCSQSLTIKMEVISRVPMPGLYGYLEIIRGDGTTLLVTDSFDGGNNPLSELAPGGHDLSLTIPSRILGFGTYRVYANFTSRANDSFDVDSPGTIAVFDLTDDETRRGNRRGGLLSTAPAWESRRHLPTTCYQETTTK